MYQNFITPYLYEAKHVLGDTPPIIRSLKLHWQPLVLHTWRVVGRVVGGRCQAQCAWQRPPTRSPTTFHVWRTGGCQCSCRLLMMGSVSPETCWASYKYGIIKILIHCYTLLYFSLWIIRVVCRQSVYSGKKRNTWCNSTRVQSDGSPDYDSLPRSVTSWNSVVI